MRHYLILLCTLLLAACGRTPLQEQQAYVFGTRVEVIVVSSEAEQGRQAIAAVLREFDRLHRAYHAWQPSELSALNSSISQGQPRPEGSALGVRPEGSALGVRPAGSALGVRPEGSALGVRPAGSAHAGHQVTPELADFAREAQALSAQGDGLFDPGIGQLIKLWGFQADEFKAQLPAPNEIKAWLASKPSMADLTITEHTISSRNPDVALDFGGYLKGVALDRAAAILRGQGINNALINIGGNVMALGSKEGRKWRVGIQHPRQPGPLATVELANGEAIGTSGDYQRFFEVDGQRYSHLLDPRTGYPADHTQAVTVLIPAGPKAGTLSDAASKPIFIAGPDGWREMAQKMKIDLVLRVDRNNRIFVTEAMRQRLEFIGQAPKLSVVP